MSKRSGGEDGIAAGSGGNNGSPFPNPSVESSAPSLRNNPLQMLGITMIVDQRGSGARLVARYPTQPSTTHSAVSSGGDKGAGGRANRSTEEDHLAEDDLFFTLTAHQMAKLFRTKKSLCNQPMTLRVNRTVFCCHSVLIDGEDEDPTVQQNENNTSISSINGNTDGGGHTDDDLRLFSVVVALSSVAHQTANPFSSFWDAGSEDQHDLERFLRQTSTSSTRAGHGNGKTATTARVSSTFLAIRRVHISLARYCRALAREENRCGYVRHQANSFFTIRSEQQKRWEAPLSSVHASPSGMTSSNVHHQHNHHGQNAVSSSASVMTQNTLDQKGRHKRSNSYGNTSATLVLDDVMNSFVKGSTVEQEQEKEQEILELMLASPAPPMLYGSPQHHGNLVRELVTVFHALSRNDHEYPRTPNSLLCERDAVVYVNQHIAVPIEAAGLDCSQTIDGPVVRPYYTLLFPHASPSELLQTFHSGSAPPQRMEQLLLAVNPQKSLAEIAIDAGLPLHLTIDISSFLVTRGACIASPVVSSQSRLVCASIQKLPEVALEFTQAFAEVNIFGLVSFLTTSRTLGDTMAILTDLTNDEGARIRETLLASPSFRMRSPDIVKSIHILTSANNTGIEFDRGILPVPDGEETTSGHPQQQQPQHPRPSQLQEEPILQQCVKDLEELLYAMAIWLLSHNVLTHLQEYLVVVGLCSASSSTTELMHTVGAAYRASSSSSLISTLKRPTPEDTPSGSHAAMTSTGIQSTDYDTNLFKELIDAGYLNGDLSITAISWKTGIDPPKLRSWGMRHPQVRVVCRMPTAGDDWEASTVSIESHS
jgi:hypothetical protein